MSVACVNDEKGIVFKPRIENLCRERKSVVHVADCVVKSKLFCGRGFGCDSFEIFVVVVDVDFVRVVGNLIILCKLAVPIIFGQIFGEIDCAVIAGKVCVGIAQTCKHQRELHCAQSVGFSCRSVDLRVECARSVVKVVVARCCENLEVFISRNLSYFVLHIAKGVCNVHKSRRFAVLGQVARRKHKLRTFAVYCVLDESFHLLFQDDAAFKHELGVARHGIVKIARFVVVGFYILIAVVKRKVVNVAKMPER